MEQNQNAEIRDAGDATTRFEASLLISIRALRHHVHAKATHAFICLHKRNQQEWREHADQGGLPDSLTEVLSL